MKAGATLTTRLALAFCVLAIGAFAADVTGRWSGELRDSHNDPHPVNLTLKQDGNVVTGTVGTRAPAEISDGKVDGDTVTFAVIRKAAGNMRKVVYTGKIEGEQIRFKEEILVGQAKPVVTNFTVTRAGQ